MQQFVEKRPAKTFETHRVPWALEGNFCNVRWGVRHGQSGWCYCSAITSGMRPFLWVSRTAVSRSKAIVVAINFECLPVQFRAQIGLSACECGPWAFRLLVFCISRNGHYELIVPAETSQRGRSSLL